METGFNNWILTTNHCHVDLKLSCSGKMLIRIWVSQINKTHSPEPLRPGWKEEAIHIIPVSPGNGGRGRPLQHSSNVLWKPCSWLMEVDTWERFSLWEFITETSADCSLSPWYPLSSTASISKLEQMQNYCSILLCQADPITNTACS